MRTMPPVRRTATARLRAFVRWVDDVTLDHFNPHFFRPRG